MKITQADLAFSLGVTQSAVAKWETGDSFPSFKQLVKLKNFFGCSIEELLKDEVKQDAP